MVHGPSTSFRNPPIEEVACSLQFQPLRGLRIPYLGLLWQRLGADFPKVEHAPPIVRDSSLVVDEVTGSPLPRVWFIGKDESYLIQFQLDRYVFNWRKRGATYPRFPEIFRRYSEGLSSVHAMVSEYQLGALEPSGYDLTYVNIISHNHGWRNLADLSNVFKCMLWTPDATGSLSPPQGIRWQLVFPLPDNVGTLSANLKLVTQNRNEVLVLELTAKTKDRIPPLTEMPDWFDMAHKHLVNAFRELTTEHAQVDLWGREMNGRPNG